MKATFAIRHLSVLVLLLLVKITCALGQSAPLGPTSVSPPNIPPGPFLLISTNPLPNLNSAAIIAIIEFADVPLVSGLETLAPFTGLNYIIRPGLSGSVSAGETSVCPEPSVSFRWENLTAREGLERLLKREHLVMIENPATAIAVITHEDLKLNEVKANLLGPDTNGVISLIQAKQMPLTEMLRALARQANLQIEIQIEPSWLRRAFVARSVYDPKVTVCWHGVTARQAILALCENYQLVLQQNTTNDPIRIKRQD